MTIAHTPGPWTFEPVPPDAHTDPDILTPDDCVFWIAEARPAGQVLALIEQRPRANGESEANARLIATAPELLAALKAQRCDFCGYRLGVPREPRSGPACETCAPARAVIANVEGAA